MTVSVEELRRLAALQAYDIVDTPDEQAFDDLAVLAGQICEAPVALVTLIDLDRQWFKARTGVDERETPRDISVCTHAIAQDADLYVVADMALDPLFADGPLVNGQHKVRFYAGAKLVTPSGEALGTLCVLDNKARPGGLTEHQASALLTLSRQVMSLMELRRALARRREGEARLRAVADTMPQMVWATPPDGSHDYYNARWYEFTGMPVGSTDGEAWDGVFHPDDVGATWRLWRASLATGEPYETEYRLRHHSGHYRWVLARALPIRGDNGRITRWFGTCTDIHEQKRLQQQEALLGRELGHRIKNIFSVVTGLVALSARRFPEAAAFSADLRDRIVALGRAHDFVQPEQIQKGHDSTLVDLLTSLLAPYQSDSGSRINLASDVIMLGDQAVTPLALVVHELATNAAKYGALSKSDGSVQVEARRAGDQLRLVWTERGGPPAADPGDRLGFGTTLVRLSIQSQLGGTITRDWNGEGLIVTLTAPLKAIERQG